MWFDEPPSQRVGNLRAAEALATGADTVGVGCPFCMIMLTDAMAQVNPEARVLDLAELLAERLPEPLPVQNSTLQAKETQAKQTQAEEHTP